MTTWHDIADQLTPTQVEQLEWLEGDPLGGLLARPEQHLMLARGWAGYNLEQVLHADVPPPADAVQTGPWQRMPGGSRCRTFRSVIGIGGLDVEVEISGSQFTDGRIDGRVSLSGDVSHLDAAGARDVAAALTAATERLEER